jgi:4-alpha-glucanotransferase
MPRRSGVLIPLFSIRTPSGWGLGEIPDLVAFSAWARDAGFSVVQMLPVNQPSPGQESPYAACTAFALDPVYLSLDACEDFQGAGGTGALSDEDRLLLSRVRSAQSVPWHDVRPLKDRALRLAFAHFLARHWSANTARAEELRAFARDQGAWLEEFVLFMALHAERNLAWSDWEPELARRTPAALQQHRARLEPQLLFLRWVQWQLQRQWATAREAVSSLGVKLMGDLPFVVAGDSADVWANQGEFRLDARVGVPPDAFSADGQDWGLPVFRWDVMGGNDLAWFRARGHRAASMFDYYRVDHVVGLYRTYHRFPDGRALFSPDTVPEQTRNGERVLKTLAERATVIAEDLGTVPDFVRASLTGLQIPGYRVLRWEKDDTVFRDPMKWPALSVGVTGTHDTDSVADWFETALPAERRAFLEIPALAALKARAPTRFDEGVRDAVLDLIFRCGSDLTLIPFQDALGTRERVNVPGTVAESNWTYRMPMDVGALQADRATVTRLRDLALRSNRLA